MHPILYIGNMYSYVVCVHLKETHKSVHTHNANASFQLFTFFSHNFRTLYQRKTAGEGKGTALLSNFHVNSKGSTLGEN